MRTDEFADSMHRVPLGRADEDACNSVVQLEATLGIVGHLLPDASLVVLVAKGVNVCRGRRARACMSEVRG